MIFTQIQQDCTLALKNSEKVKLTTLRNLIAAVKYKLIENKASEPTDSDCIEVIRKQITQLIDGKAQFLKGNREDLANEYEIQIKILERYLPQELSDDALEAELNQIISENQNLVATKPQAILGIAVGRLKEKATSARIVGKLKPMLGI